MSPGRTSTCSSSTSPRASSSIRPAAIAAARSCTGCWRSTRPAATTTSGPASSTGSTATRRACSWSRARRRLTRRLQELIRRRELERRYLALVRGAPAVPDGPDRGADRPRPRRPLAPLARHRDPARGDHALRDARAAASAHAARGAARDGPHAPDPRAPGGDRAPGRGRPGLRRRRRPRASSASSCTRRGSRSRIRSRASGWTSSRRCRPTSPRRSDAPARLTSRPRGRGPKRTRPGTVPGRVPARHVPRAKKA